MDSFAINTHTHTHTHTHDLNDIQISDFLLEENIKRLDMLYINNKIKSKKNIEQKQNNLGLFDDDDDEEVIKFISENDNRLSIRMLMRNTDLKLFHDIYENEGNIEIKARLLSYRSAKSSSWLQSQIGPEIETIYDMDNITFSTMTRIHFGKNIIPINSDQERKCIKCNQKMDENGIHTELCKVGAYGLIYRHDGINKYIFNYINQFTNNIEWEPRKLDDTNRERPDIIIRDKIKMKNGGYNQCYLDTRITNIYTKENLESIENGDIKIFNAGLNAEAIKIRDYADKFENLQKLNYQFIPVGIEINGGISKNLRYILNLYIENESRIKNKDLGILVHNFYIKVSLFIQKMRFNSIWSRISSWR